MGWTTRQLFTACTLSTRYRIVLHGTEPADIRVRIRINPGIWIRIPHHFSLRLDALAEVCALCVQPIISSLFFYLFVL